MGASQAVAKHAVTFDAEKHIYRIGDRELVSVTKLLKTVWPLKPKFEAADPVVLENARDRGIEVDSLLSRYAAGQLEAIPLGTRKDASELFLKAKEWVDVAVQAGSVQSQVILTDGDIAGTCDFIVAGPVIADLKATYDVEVYYPLQLGLYALLYEEQFGHAVEGLGILHVTARFPRAKWIALDVDECKRDASMIREVWRMAQRRTAK